MVPTNEQYNEIAVDWPMLTSDSVVWEVGAYKGSWTKRIYNKYKCNMYCFEPQLWAYIELYNAVRDINKIRIFNYALGTHTKDEVPMGEYGTDACSFLHVGEREQGTGKMIDAKVVMKGVKRIDLMMINIEGYEYTLLEYMIQHKLLDPVQTLVVQWHTFADITGTLYNTITSYLDQHYTRIWSHFPTLEAWSRDA